MPIIKGKGTFMTLISGSYKGLFYTGGSNDVWVQSLSYGPSWKSETQSAFGSNDPVSVDDTYDGISASFDIIETASKMALEILTRQVTGAGIGFDPSLYQTAYLVANFKDTKWVSGDDPEAEYIGSVLLKGLKVVAADTSSAVDGVQTKKFDFDGTGVIEYAKPLQIDQFTTAGGGNEEFTLTKTTADAYPAGKYAQLVMLDDVVLSLAAGDYTETALAVTLVADVAIGKKLTVIYAYTPA